MPSHVPAPTAFVTDSNRPQSLRQPPPTACLTAPGAAFEAPSLRMHPWAPPPSACHERWCPTLNPPSGPHRGPSRGGGHRHGPRELVLLRPAVDLGPRPGLPLLLLLRAVPPRGRAAPPLAHGAVPGHAAAALHDPVRPRVGGGVPDQRHRGPHGGRAGGPGGGGAAGGVL